MAGFRRGILRTRLLPPRVPVCHLERPGLLDQILGGFHGRLTALVAGAGYGKSTMLALAAEQAGCPWVWCSCDPRMATSGIVLGHIATGLSERFPGFGATMGLSGPPRRRWRPSATRSSRRSRTSC